MFSIYISATALANTYLQECDKPFEKQSDWYKILCRSSKIFTYGYDVDTSKDDIIDENDISDLAVLDSISLSGNLSPADDYVESILSDNKAVLKHPNAAFFLDIDSTEAKNIQENYGVICQSVKEPIDTSVFTRPSISVNFEKDKKSDKGWDKVLQEPAKLPSNSICIIDRYLFDDKQAISIGLNTITLILLYALPNKFNDTYHVTIIYDQNGYNLREIAQQIFRVAEKISEDKGYKIKVQILAIDDNEASYTHKWTHNRRIMSAYYIIPYGNGVNVLCYNEQDGETQAMYNQRVQASTLYENCLMFEDSDPPISEIDVVRKQAKECIERWQSGRNKYTSKPHYYYLDNEGHTTINNFNIASFS